jgi:hypothetical protein
MRLPSYRRLIAKGTWAPRISSALRRPHTWSAKMTIAKTRGWARTTRGWPFGRTKLKARVREPTRWAVTGVLVVVLTGATGAAFASQGWTDLPGDAEPAPDIERVTVDIDPATARLRFLISTPNRTQLATNEAIFVYVDLDPDRTPAFDRLEYELIIHRGTCRSQPDAPVCSPSWGFAYANADGRVSMTFKPERAVPIDFKVVAVHFVDGRSYGDSAPNPGTSKRARHYRIESALFAEACVVPNVRGMRLGAARRAIVRAHCAVGHVTRLGSRKGASRVSRQAPPPRALLPRHGRVDLVVSSRRSMAREGSKLPANRHLFAAAVCTGVCTVLHESHVSHAYALTSAATSSHPRSRNAADSAGTPPRSVSG